METTIYVDVEVKIIKRMEYKVTIPSKSLLEDYINKTKEYLVDEFETVDFAKSKFELTDVSYVKDSESVIESDVYPIFLQEDQITPFILESDD